MFCDHLLEAHTADLKRVSANMVCVKLAKVCRTVRQLAVEVALCLRISGKTHVLPAQE